MKIFLDTADVKALSKYALMGVIDGVTTNPTNLSSVGGDPKKHILEICALMPDGDISVEVTEIEPEKMYVQAKQIAALADNVVVKIPCHASYYPIIKRLVEEEVRINITLVFSLAQGLYMSKLGVCYISPFVGRWDDIDGDGMALVQDLCQMMDQYSFETEVLAASIRSVRQFHAAIVAGAHVITLPVSLFEQSLHHPLTDSGMDKFTADWKKLGLSQFP